MSGALPKPAAPGLGGLEGLGLRLLRDRGFCGLLAARLVQLMNSFFISIILVRRFGFAAAGTYAVAAPALSILALSAGLGLASALPREKLDDRERATAGLLVTTALLPAAAVAASVYGLAFAASSGEALALAAFALAGFFMGQASVLQTLSILQKRPAASLLPAIATTVAVGAGATLAPTVAVFAVFVLAGRSLGNLLGAAALRYRRISCAEFRTAAWGGSAFAPIDVVAMLSEQLPILILSALLTRAEIGVFGLARQIVTAADQPGWSYLQAKYPELCDSPLATTPGVALANARLARAVAAIGLAGAAFLGCIVYHSPEVAAVAVLLLLAMPARYLNNLCDQVMRAAGRIRQSLGLAVLKLALSLFLFAALASAFGLWGASIAAVTLSLISGALYRTAAGALVPRPRTVHGGVA